MLRTIGYEAKLLVHLPDMSKRHRFLSRPRYDSDRAKKSNPTWKA